LKLRQLSQEALAPFAELLDSGGRRRTDLPAALEPGPGAGRASLAIIRTEPTRETEISFARLERHPYSAQTFVPISAGRFCVVVAPKRPDGSPDIDGMRAFIAGSGDAILYHRDAWHASMIALDQAADMATIMWRRDAGDDTIVFDLPAPVTLTF
jgi:ureidoglycolate lyase